MGTSKAFLLSAEEESTPRASAASSRARSLDTSPRRSAAPSRDAPSRESSVHSIGEAASPASATPLPADGMVDASPMIVDDSQLLQDLEEKLRIIRKKVDRLKSSDGDSECEDEGMTKYPGNFE